MPLFESGSYAGSDSRESILESAFSIICGRAAAFIVAFFVPVIFARIFTPAEFGTYKQLFLIHATLCALAELGLAESLYYFLPSEPEKAGRYTSNSILVLTATGLACLILVATARDWIAYFFRNRALSEPAALLGGYVALTLASAPLEIIMMARRRHWWASAVYALSGAARAVFMLAPVLVWPRLEALLAGATAFAALRVVGMLLYLPREFDAGLRPDAACLGGQLKYSLPLQLAVSLEVLQANLHYYVVSWRFDASTFAIYAIGCLQIPLIDVIANSACNVMMVRMSERIRDGRPQMVHDLWLDTTRKLALIFLPLLGLLFVASGDLITFLFSNAYAASIPVFRIWLLVLLFSTFQPHGVLRVYGETRFLAAQNMVKLLMVLALIQWLMSAFHLVGAVVVTALSALLGKSLSLARMKSAGRINLRHLLPWSSLAATAAVTAAACLLAFSLRARLGPSPMPALIWTGLIYTIGYAALAWRFGLLTGSEKKRVIEWAHRWSGWMRRSEAESKEV